MVKVRFSGCLVWFATIMLVVPAIYAQDFPVKPIRIVISGAGGPSDIAAARRAGDRGPLEQPVVVDNRAAGNTIMEAVQKAPPDGYAILLYGSALWLGPFMQSNAPYDPVACNIPTALHF